MKTAAAVMFILVIMVFAGCEPGRVNPDVLYQSSNIAALMAGMYDGDVTLAQLARKGDFGVGVYNALNGELILHQGAFYRIDEQFRAIPIVSEEDLETSRAAFAAVTFFGPDESVTVTGMTSFDQFQRHVDHFLANPNAFYAVRIEGLIRYVKVRVSPGQSRPYRPFADVVANQRGREFHNVRGVLLGFRMPAYMAGVNVPGYNLYFITADRSLGGQVLDLQLDSITVELDRIERFEMNLPGTELFRRVPTATGDQAATIRFE